MAGDDQRDDSVSVSLPPEVDDWLAETADERDQTRDELCRRLVTAAHSISTDDETADEFEATFDEVTGQLEDVDTRLDAVDDRLDEQRTEFVDLLEDVRSRVIQVKRETDAKAPADHEHSSHADDTELEALRDDLEVLEDRLEGGFDNFETILEDLLARLDDVDDRSTTLARAVLDLREHHDAVVERNRRRAGADRLKLAANRLGVRTAACDACDASVDIALLTAPTCPDCGASFADVVENTSFFGSHTLVTGDPPALEEPHDGLETNADDVCEAFESDATGETVEPDTAGDSDVETAVADPDGSAPPTEHSP